MAFSHSNRKVDDKDENVFKHPFSDRVKSQQKQLLSLKLVINNLLQEYYFKIDFVILSYFSRIKTEGGCQYCKYNHNISHVPGLECRCFAILYIVLVNFHLMFDITQPALEMRFLPTEFRPKDVSLKCPLTAPVPGQADPSEMRREKRAIT